MREPHMQMTECSFQASSAPISLPRCPRLARRLPTAGIVRMRRRSS